MLVVQDAEAVIASVGERATVVVMVRARLQQSAYHAIRSITCELHEGVVTLRGRVPSYHLKQMAQELVRSTPGVIEINNRIAVNLARAKGGEKRG